MAINKTINKRTNTHGAMRNCIEYVLRQDKTSELLTYVTGPYCRDEIKYDLVYRTFLEEKKMWDKDSGRMYAHNIISWHKDEQITPEQALEFGKEFAENWFSGFQTLVAVHKDKDHIHCHLVTNSVSYEDGRKLHNTKKDLERMKQLTNQMCRERGLTVAEKGKHFDESQIEKGEVIAWSKDKYNLFRQQVKDSFVADCAMAVLNKRTNTHGAMRNCIEYVLRQDKTNELFTCVTGPYCHDEINYDLVYRTFLEEKKVWDKDSGRMYAHNIISWHKDEQITPEQALEFGKEFAENWFSGFQTLVAVKKSL